MVLKRHRLETTIQDNHVVATSAEIRSTYPDICIVNLYRTTGNFSVYEQGDAISALISMVQSLQQAKYGVDVLSDSGPEGESKTMDLEICKFTGLHAPAMGAMDANTDMIKKQYQATISLKPNMHIQALEVFGIGFLFRLKKQERLIAEISYQMQDNSKDKDVHRHVFDHFANNNRIVPSAEYTSQQPSANTRNQHGTYMVQQHSVLPTKATINARCSTQGCDAVGKADISALVKCTSAIRQLAYAAVSDSLEKYTTKKLILILKPI
ncbi:hypothetical protein Tco_0200065 [Tanacetum coccineum]